MGTAAVLAGCGIGVQRDLTDKPAKDVVIDDMCGLQKYHDLIAVGTAPAPSLVSANDLESTEGPRAAGGRARYLFETPLQLETLRGLLRQNWDGVPDRLLAADKVELEVLWSEKAGLKRVVTTRDAEIQADAKAWDLPYHVCLSDLLFGMPLYQTRRQLLGLAPLPEKNPAKAGPPRPQPAASTTGHRVEGGEPGPAEGTVEAIEGSIAD
jgi:hypothetical protein